MKYGRLLCQVKLSLKIQTSDRVPSTLLDAVGVSSLIPHHTPQREKNYCHCITASDVTLTTSTHHPTTPVLLLCMVGVLNSCLGQVLSPL